VSEQRWVIGNSRSALLKALSLLGSFLIQQKDDFELILRTRVYKRSNEQNKRMWALLNEISERLPVQGIHHAPEVWHEYFKVKFIGKEEVKLPNGKVLERAISTTTLDVAAFGEYMTRIEVWAAEHGLLFAEAA